MSSNSKPSVRWLEAIGFLLVNLLVLILLLPVILAAVVYQGLFKPAWEVLRSKKGGKN